MLNSLAHVSGIFVFRFAKIWQTTETYSPQTFSVTAAVVAPAVVNCLNSLISPSRGRGGQKHAQQVYESPPSGALEYGCVLSYELGILQRTSSKRNLRQN